MTFKVIKIFLLSFLISENVFAEIDTFEDKDLHLSVGYEIQQYSILLENETSGREITYTPNIKGLIVPRMTFKDYITLSWAFEEPVSENEKILKGETKYTDVRMAFNISSIRLSFYYLQYRGFYIENSQELDARFGQFNPEIQFPNLYSQSLGGELTWIKNSKDFSLKVLDSQTERMNKSAGSLLAGLAFSQTHFIDSSGIIPLIVQNDFQTDADLTGGDFNTLATKIGYGYIKSKDWFFGGTFQLGPGITQVTIKKTDGSSSRDTALSMRAEAMIAMGYNSDRYFISLKSDVRQDYFYLNNSATSIGTQLLSGGLTFGLHLDKF